MLPKNTIFIFLLFPLLAWGLFLSLPGEASAKTIYVEKDGDDSNDGSKDSPFKTLEEAAEEVNEGEADEVRLGKGSFEGSVIFEEGVNIKGEGKGSTTITGPLTFKKKTELSGISIKTKSHNAVVLGKNATAKISNVDIRDFTKVGILLTAGNAVLTLEDSRIGGSSGKGIYAEKGSKLNLNGNTIVNNKQEGIDIRQNTRGAIKNNTIENNGESGIELIVGSSDFEITGNRIKDNNASGIAFQFYELNNKFGTIIAKGNTITGHRKYGVDCNRPQGGNAPPGYWADSITAEENVFGSNKIADLSTACKLIEAKTAEEEQALQDELQQEEKVEQEVAAPETEVVDQAAEQQKIEAENQATEAIVESIEGAIDEEKYQVLINTTHTQKFQLLAWLGLHDKALEELRKEIGDDRLTLEIYRNELQASHAYKNRLDWQERVTAQEKKLAEYQQILEGYEQKKGVAEYVSQDVFKRVTKLLYVIIL